MTTVSCHACALPLGVMAPPLSTWIDWLVTIYSLPLVSMGPVSSKQQCWHLWPCPLADCLAEDWFITLNWMSTYIHVVWNVWSHCIINPKNFIDYVSGRIKVLLQPLSIVALDQLYHEWLLDPFSVESRATN